MNPKNVKHDPRIYQPTHLDEYPEFRKDAIPSKTKKEEWTLTEEEFDVLKKVEEEVAHLTATLENVNSELNLAIRRLARIGAFMELIEHNGV